MSLSEDVTYEFKEDWIKLFENGPLYNYEKKSVGSSSLLKVHFDGVVNYAVGYGLDLAVREWGESTTEDSIQYYLDKAVEDSGEEWSYEDKITCNYTKYSETIVTVGRDSNVTEGSESINKEYTLKEIIKKYKSDIVEGLEKNSEEHQFYLYVVRKGFSTFPDTLTFDNKTNILRRYPDLAGNTYSFSTVAKREVYLKIKNLFESIVKHMEKFSLPSKKFVQSLFKVMYPKYENLTKNKLGQEKYNKLNDCQKYALVSMVYNAGSGVIGNNLKSHITNYIKYKDESNKEKEYYYRTYAWAEIQYASNSSKNYGLAVRRNREALLFGLADDNSDFIGLEIKSADEIDEFCNKELEKVSKLPLVAKKGIKLALEGISANKSSVTNLKYASDYEEAVKENDEKNRTIKMCLASKLYEKVESNLLVYNFIDINSYLSLYHLDFMSMDSYAQRAINESEGEKEVVIFEKNKSSEQCETSKKVSELKEGDLIYLEESETLLKALVNQLSDSEEASIEDIKNYIEERTGKEIDSNNEELMSKMLENYTKLKEGDYSYLVRQENFDMLRTLEGKIGFKDLFFYMLRVDKENKPLKFISSIFEGIEYNEMRDLELGSLKENHEDDEWYKLLKSYEDEEKLKISTNTDYRIAREVLDILLIRYMEKRFNAKIGRVLENILLEYHKENVITLHGNNGMYNKVNGLVSSGKVDVFIFITSYDNEEKLKYYFEKMNESLNKIKRQDREREYLFYLKSFYEEDNFLVGEERLNDLDMAMELAKGHSASANCISFIESFYDRVALIRKEARSRGRIIDDVSDALIVEYYGEGENGRVKSDLIYKVAIAVLEKTNLSVFQLSKSMNPNGGSYQVEDSSNDVNKVWIDYKKLLEKLIKDDFDNYRKNGYIGNNTINPPEAIIDELLRGFTIFSNRQSHYFFKSFREITEEERRQEAQEQRDREQEEEWNNLPSNGSVTRIMEVEGKVIACIDGEWGYYSKEAYRNYIGEVM